MRSVIALAVMLTASEVAAPDCGCVECEEGHVATGYEVEHVPCPDGAWGWECVCGVEGTAVELSICTAPDVTEAAVVETIAPFCEQAFMVPCTCTECVNR